MSDSEERLLNENDNENLKSTQYNSISVNIH